MLDPATDPQCTAPAHATELKTVNSTMHVISFVLSAVFSYCNIVDANKVEFPSNMTKVLGLCALGYHSANIFLGIVWGYEQLDPTHTWADSPGYAALCQAQALSTQLFAFGMFCWWMLISITVFRLVVRGAPMASVRRMKRSYYLFGIGGPLLFTALPLVLGLFSADSGFLACWVDRKDSAVWQFALLFGEMGIGVTLSLCWAARIIARLHAVGKEVLAGGGRHGFLPQMVRHTGFMLTMATSFALLCWWGVAEAYWSGNGPADPDGGHPWALCLASTVNVSSLGTTISLVFLPTRNNWLLLSAPLRRCGLLRALPLRAPFEEGLMSSGTGSSVGLRGGGRASEDDSIGAWGAHEEAAHERPPSSLADDQLAAQWASIQNPVAHGGSGMGAGAGVGVGVGADGGVDLDAPAAGLAAAAHLGGGAVLADGGGGSPGGGVGGGRAYYRSDERAPSGGYGFSRADADSVGSFGYGGGRNAFGSDASLHSRVSSPGLDGHGDDDAYYAYADDGHARHGPRGLPGDEHYGDEWGDE